MTKMQRDFIVLYAINLTWQYSTWDEIEKELLPHFKKMGLKKKEKNTKKREYPLSI